MRRILSFLLTFCLLAAPLPALATQDTAAAAQDVLFALADGEYAAVFAQCDPAMREALGDADGLADVWRQLTDMMGALEDAQAADAGEQSGYRLVSAQCAFARADAVLSLAFDAQGRLCSLGLVDMRARETAAEADAGGYVEEEIALRAGEADETGGLLTLPEGDGPFPAVILVHGSGPSDRDETAYVHAPFRDIAHGLARLGVASVRYDKYTYAHPQLCLDADFTVDDEYTRDAVDAAELLAGDARIGGIYLLGHSQGAMLAPRIMRAVREKIGKRLCGGVLLAGSPLHMWQIQYRQNLDVLAALGDAATQEDRAMIEAEAAKAETLTGLSAAQLQAETLFGISAFYQADEMSVDAARLAAQLDLPLFIAQGAKDWQVRPEDGIDAWRAALPEDMDVTYRLYADMNHMLIDMEGEPTGSAADYMDADARTSEELIEDIAAWILS